MSESEAKMEAETETPESIQEKLKDLKEMIGQMPERIEETLSLGSLTVRIIAMGFPRQGVTVDDMYEYKFILKKVVTLLQEGVPKLEEIVSELTKKIAAAQKVA